MSAGTGPAGHTEAGLVKQRPYALGRIAAFSPEQLANLLQFFLPGNGVDDGYSETTLNSIPVLIPKEPGTLAVPRAGRCWTFDGSNDYAVKTAFDQLNGLATATFCAIVTPLVLAEYKGIVAWFQNGSDRFQVCAMSNGAVRVLAYRGGAGGEVFTSGGVLANNTQSHVAVVFDGSQVNANRIKIYINGLAVSTSVTGTVPTLLHNASSPLTIGAAHTGDGWFNARLKDILIDDEAYTALEVASLYATHQVPTGKTPLAFYRCEEEKGGNGALGYNCIANNNHLTFNNITEGTFHAADTGVKYSHSNEKGYTLANNLFTYSEQFDNAAWVKAASTITANATTAPNGTLTADLFSDDATNTEHLVRQNITTSTPPRTFSIYAKANASNWLVIRLSINSSWVNAFFNVSSGTVGTVAPAYTSASITSAGNGWYRCSVTASAINNSLYQLLLSPNGSSFSYSGGSNSIYIWGAQLEDGSTSSPYTITTSTAQTNVVIPASLSDPTKDAAGNALGVAGPVNKPATLEVPCVTLDQSLSVYGASGGRITTGTVAALTVAAWVKPSLFNGRAIAGEWGGQGWLFCFESTGLMLYLSGSGGVSQNYYAYSTADTWVHVCATYDGPTQTVKLYINGSQVTILQVGTVPTQLLTPGAFNVGRHAAGSYYFNGSICDVYVKQTALSSGSVLALKNGSYDKSDALAYYPIQEGPGSSNTNRTSYDTVGNNHLTWNNGTVASHWANKCPYVRSWCIENGGSYNPNMLSYSNDFSNAVWNKDNITFAAGKITETTANSYHALYSADVTQSYPSTFSIKLKAAERSFVSLSLDTFGDVTRWAVATFNLSTGTIASQSNTSTAVVSWAITGPDVDGYYRISMTCTSVGNMTANRVARLSLNTTGTPTRGNFGLEYYAGNAANGVLLKESQLEPGSVATPYQATTVAQPGAFIPGRIGSNLDAAGNAKTLAAGKFGNPYARLNRNRFNMPSLNNIGITASDSIAPSTNVQALSVVDTQFRRNKTDGSDRYFATLAALTGSNKTNAQNYTG